MASPVTDANDRNVSPFVRRNFQLLIAISARLNVLVTSFFPPGSEAGTKLRALRQKLIPHVAAHMYDSKYCAEYFQNNLAEGVRYNATGNLSVSAWYNV